MHDTVTLTQYERDAMFRIPDVDSSPLPAVTRHPVEIDGEVISILDASRPSVCIGIAFVPQQSDFGSAELSC
jgi:hypothetical protein